VTYVVITDPEDLLVQKTPIFPCLHILKIADTCNQSPSLAKQGRNEKSPIVEILGWRGISVSRSE
jgi:hypothetical protein